MSRVAFITSNGTGLGHVTRSLAIARRLPEDVEPLLATHSLAAPVVAGEGVEIEYWPSHGAPGAGGEWRWSSRLEKRVEELLADVAPQVVVFDGVRPYLGLVDALAREPRTSAVWLRRSMWRPGGGSAALALSGRFDLIVEPGEIAAGHDRGPTAAARSRGRGPQVETVGPITIRSRDELVGRERAARELGLDSSRLLALVALGQGSRVAEAARRSVEALAGRPEVQVAVLESALAASVELPDGVVRLRSRYPIAPLLRCFDLSVSAAGYNAVHELAAAGVPSLLVPVDREVDDQAARAQGLAAEGLARAVEEPGSPLLEAELEALLDEGERASIASRLGALAPFEGASQAAGLLSNLARGEAAGAAGGVGSAARRPTPGTRAASAIRARWRFWAAAPLRTALASRPRLVIHAEGLAGEELLAVAEREASARELSPDRVLVLVDGLDFQALAARGYGVEQMPGPSSSRDPARADRRLEVALAGRGRGLEVVDARPLP